MKNLILLICCLITLSTFAQEKNTQFFLEGGVQTGFTKSSNLHFTNYDYVMWCFFGPIEIITPDRALTIKDQSTYNFNFNTGLIINNKWYLSSGIRYGQQKYFNKFDCFFCEGNSTDGFNTQINSIDIPLSLRYRVIPDLPISPIVMAEAFISFKEIDNNLLDELYIHQGIQTNIKEQFGGYRLGVGLNYQLNPSIAFNLMASWGKTLLLDHIFDKSEEDHWGMPPSSIKLKDYQLGFSVINTFGK